MFHFTFRGHDLYCMLDSFVSLIIFLICKNFDGKRQELCLCIIEEGKLVQLIRESDPKIIQNLTLQLITSREKPTAGAPKLLIPGEFQLASDTNAGGNALSLAHCPIHRR
jgi:hypothetical protein